MDKPGPSNPETGMPGPDAAAPTDATLPIDAGVPAGPPLGGPAGPEAGNPGDAAAAPDPIPGSPEAPGGTPETSPQPLARLRKIGSGMLGAAGSLAEATGIKELPGKTVTTSRLAAGGLRLGAVEIRHKRARHSAASNVGKIDEYKQASGAMVRTYEVKRASESDPTYSHTRKRGETHREFTERTGLAEPVALQGKIPKLNEPVSLPKSRGAKRQYDRVSGKLAKIRHHETEMSDMRQQHGDKITGEDTGSGEKRKRSLPKWYKTKKYNHHKNAAKRNSDKVLKSVAGEDRATRRLKKPARVAKRTADKLTKLRTHRAKLRGETYTPPTPEQPPKVEAPKKRRGPEKSPLDAHTPDTSGYGELISVLEARGVDGAGFNAAIDARQTVGALSTGDLGGPIGDREANNGGMHRQTALKLAQRRHIARSLGLRVGPVEVDRQKASVKSEVSVPNENELLPAPTWDDKLKSYVDHSGRTVSQDYALTQFSAHYLAENRDAFSEPEAFQDAAAAILKQASTTGKIVIKAGEPDQKGRAAFENQLARALGYDIESVQPDPGTGDVTLTVKKAKWMTKGKTGSSATLRQPLAPLGDVAETTAPAEAGLGEAEIIAMYRDLNARAQALAQAAIDSASKK